ncbi:hypothetical protein [Brevibacillus parabrevis]|uniref:hypothetical protein n=1 Tax=Brevibacillus parabrevis TaxID=54914 RepID=UPI0023802A18|nr:hypothetical protein [Brevibacillus parabrevis]WDV94192.1 hypothetical protein PSE45_21520 [Brevibacillus parabrevis]
MPTWIWIQVGLMLFWAIVGYLIYQAKLWKASFLLGKTGAFKIIFFGLVPIAWCISSIIVGVGYTLMGESLGAFFSPLVMMILIPAVLLTIRLVSIWYREREMRVQEREKFNQLTTFKNKCSLWVEQFPYVNPDMIDIRVHYLGSRPTGTIVIKNVTEYEAHEIEKQKSKLPEGIDLWVIPN